MMPIITKKQGDMDINAIELRNSDDVKDWANTMTTTTIAMERRRKANKPLSLNLIVNGINNDETRITLVHEIKHGIPIFEKGVEILNAIAMINVISTAGTMLMMYFSRTYCFRVKGKVKIYAPVVRLRFSIRDLDIVIASIIGVKATARAGKVKQ